MAYFKKQPINTKDGRRYHSIDFPEKVKIMKLTVIFLEITVTNSISIDMVFREWIDASVSQALITAIMKVHFFNIHLKECLSQLVLFSKFQ